MRLRHLRIRIATDNGRFGVDIPFGDGLIVLRAENSMGKSTCIKSIMVALGMEATLTASQNDLPLPPVMKVELQTEQSDNPIAQVIESDIYVEIENLERNRVVVHRTVKGARDKNLVEVTFGPALSVGGSYRSEQFFVSREGAATRERGFHHFLAEFVGWQLPIVKTYQGRECPLYMQCIFPYCVVEQSRGWGSLEPPLPTQWGIREVHRRAVEFLLNFDAMRIATRRLELVESQRELESRWFAAIQSLAEIAKNVGGVAQRLPVKPVATWPMPIPAAIMMPSNDTWIAVEQQLSGLEEEARVLLGSEIPRVSEIVQSSEAELAQAQKQLRVRETLLARLLDAIEQERRDCAGTADRLEKIEEDLQRNKDVTILMGLGGTPAPNVAQGKCPTCHQHIQDSLTPLEQGQAVMSVDDNIAFLEEQYRTFQAVRDNQTNVLAARERQAVALREEIVSLRGRIRSLRQTLVSDGRLPSIAAIRRQVELDETARRLRLADESFRTQLDGLGEFAEQWRNLQAEMATLPVGDTTDTDRAKINRWSQILQTQLRQYDFKSFTASSVAVSSDTYRPIHDGFDLPTNISASDFIRIIWAYLHGLLELSREFSTNHPGLLMFDEPRQQSAKEVSFSELLRRASEAQTHGQQVVFATSEPLASLQEMLTDLPHQLIAFEGHLIKRIHD